MNLTIDPARNTAQWQGSQIYSFGRNWAAHFLALLFQQAIQGNALTNTSLQNYLADQGQQQALNRSQLQRLLLEVNQFLALQPNTLAMHYSPRKATTGPWQLKFIQPVQHIVLGQSVARLQAPGLLEEGAEIATHLHALLSHLLVSDAFAVSGDYRPAIDCLQHIYLLPLSPEGRAVVLLREAMHTKRLGQFDRATLLLQQVLAQPTPRDHGLASYVQFQMQRLSYDQDQEANYLSLVQTVQLPVPVYTTDWRVQSEWHNLHGLLSRRSLVSAAANKSTKPDKFLVMHLAAQQHASSAIYWAVQQCNWDLLQAFVINLAYHLQTVYTLALRSCPVPLTQVFDWHKLSVAYADKLYTCKDSSWDYIFFGKFWLDHCATLEITQEGRSAQIMDNTHPSQELFYIQAIDNVEKCADPRQLGIALTLHLRYSMHYLQGAERAKRIQSLSQRYHQLLADDLTLVQIMQNEGCTSYWTN